MRPQPKLYEHDGQWKTLKEWAAASGIPESTIYARICTYGFTFSEALTMKKKKRGDFTGMKRRARTALGEGSEKR